MKKLISVLLLVAMVLSLLPVSVIAAKNEQPFEITAKATATIKEDVWDVIDAYEDENVVAKRAGKLSANDFAKVSYEIEELVKKTDTYVEGSINRNGDFFTWETTEGIVCGYSPELRYRERNVDRSVMQGENITTTSFATKGGTPSGKNVYLISPYYNDSYSADSSFTDQYKTEAKSIASATGGTFTQYGYTAATITNIAKAMQSGAVVLFDSHGITDYNSGDDYVSQANSSYLCLNTGTGITSSDMAAVTGTYGTYYHAWNGGSSTYCVDGTAIANHMTSDAPNSLLWMAICLGMATDGLNKPLHNKGVEVVYGYSQSVSFTGDYKYEASFWDSMIAGKTVASAISTMKSTYGKWDPAYSSYTLSNAQKNYVAFPIVVSSEDTYPGQGNVDAYQTVKSTWTLYQDDSSSSGSDSGSNSGSNSGNSGSSSGNTSTSGDNTYELITSSSALTAGTYIILANADGTYAGDYSYYALSTSKDGSYSAMSAQGLSFTSLPTSLTCSSSSASTFEWTMTGSRTSFTLSSGSNYLISASGSTKLTLSTSSTSWAGTYSSTYQGFRVKGNSRYISLRDDISTTGDNGNPLFCTVSSTSSGTTYLHFYKLTDSSSSSSSGSSTTTCSHSSTSTSTTAATCTSTGKTTVTCNSCGTVVSTSTIAALGHNYKYTSNSDGTHKITCSRCSYSSSASCTYSSSTCKYCGYTKPTTDSGSTSTGSISDGQYVIAAKVGSTYYAMSSTFASKITGSKITVSNGTVSASDAEGYAVTIAKNGSYYTISNGTKYLKYSSSTNFSSSTTAYNWSIGTGTNGTYRITASTSTTRGIIFYKSSTKFGAYAVSNATSTSSYYYDVELIPVSGSSSGSSDSGSNSGNTSTSGTYTYELVTSSSDLTAGSYIIVAAADGTYAGDYSYYALSTSKDGSYSAMSASGLNLSSLPSTLTCDASSVSSFEWTLTGSRTSFKLSSGSNYLISASGSTKLTLSTSSTSWSATYSSSYKGFRVKGNSRYISLRDDISTTGDNGNPLFCTVSSTSSGTTYLHFYKLVSG